MSRAIPHDKALHFIVGSVVAAFAILVTRSVGFTEVQVIGYGMTSIAVIAIFKEIYDWWSGTGNADAADVAYTLLGAILSLLCFVMGAAL